MTPSRPPAPLLETLEDALALLSTYESALPPNAASEPLPSLLQQLEAMSRRSRPQPVRSIHHFACSGGTIISKCLAAQANVVFLSEVDPLSLLHMSVAKPEFSPRSVIQQLRYSPRGNSDALIEQVFVKEIEVIRTALARNGQTLVVRDHAHSQYFSVPDIAVRPTLLEMLQKVGETRSVITVRHPLDSFLSLGFNKRWGDFEPTTLEEYALRYEQFLEDYRDLPMFKYEDFIAAPARVTAEICAALDLPFDADVIGLSDFVALSGGSGRSGPTISPRPRRTVPPEVMAQTAGPSYINLCQRLNYDCQA